MLRGADSLSQHNAQSEEQTTEDKSGQKGGVTKVEEDTTKTRS